MRPSVHCPLLASTIVTLAIALLPAAGPAAAARPTVAPEVSDCVLTSHRSAFPELLLQGETATVALKLGVSCPETERPLHLVLVMDTSANISKESAVRMTSSADSFIRQVMNPTGDETKRFGSVSFSQSARVQCSLTADLAKLDVCLKLPRPKGGSAIERGLAAGLKVLQAGRVPGNRRVKPNEVMVLYASGRNDRGCDEARSMARRVKDAGVLVIAASADDASDTTCLRHLASSARYFTDRIDSFLGPFIPARPAQIANPPILRHLDLVDTLTPGVTLVEGSVSPPATLSDDGRSLRWSVAPVRAPGITFTYRVRALQPGQLAVSSRTRADYIDLLDYKGVQDLPPAWLTVLAPADHP